MLNFCDVLMAHQARWRCNLGNKLPKSWQHLLWAEPASEGDRAPAVVCRLPNMPERTLLNVQATGVLSNTPTPVTSSEVSNASPPVLKEADS